MRERERERELNEGERRKESKWISTERTDFLLTALAGDMIFRTLTNKNLMLQSSSNAAAIKIILVIMF